jgi:hypothetical protein
VGFEPTVPVFQRPGPSPQTSASRPAIYIYYKCLLYTFRLLDFGSHRVNRLLTRPAADPLFAVDSTERFKRLSPLRNEARLVWSQQGVESSVATSSLSQTVFAADLTSHTFFTFRYRSTTWLSFFFCREADNGIKAIHKQPAWIVINTQLKRKSKVDPLHVMDGARREKRYGSYSF